MAKRFYITKTIRKYDGSVIYTPKCYKRYETMEEAVKKADELNKANTRERWEKVYLDWVNDDNEKWATMEWYEKKQKNEEYYYTFEAKESKSK